MTIIGLWVDNINSKRMDNLIKDKYLKVIEEVFRNIENKNHINYLFHKNNLKIMKDFKISDAKIIYEQNYTFGNITILKKHFEDEFIIKINYLDEEYILKTPDEQNLNDKIILNFLVFLDIFALFLIFFISFKTPFSFKNNNKRDKKLCKW
ncbi:hypothetical protein [Aliarcobacter butzleri]|uniref:hypothetical protein n=1 Tax=Aliarcobacter butzleri TaxID=28197 RepID=UPI00030ABC04|nr:hypothetical protein [Aliarcobacter butzleri]